MKQKCKKRCEDNRRKTNHEEMCNYSCRKRHRRYYCKSMMIVDVTNCSKEVAVVSKELEEIGTSIGVTIHCQREEIFEKMHRL